MSLLVNRAKVTTATTGTGTVNLGTAVVPYQTFLAAGAITGARYSYLIEDGSDWEIGEGVFTVGSPNTLSRTLIASSTGALLNLSGTATVACVAKGADSPQVIEKKVFDGTTNTYTFDEIPQDFTNLQLEIFGRTSTAALNSVPFVRLNGLSTGIYDTQRSYSTATTNTADSALAATSWALFGGLPGTTVTDTPVPGHNIIDILGYAQSTHYKSMQFRGRQPNNATTGAGYQLIGTGIARLTAAVTSVLVQMTAGNFTNGSYAILRGIP